VNEKLAAGTGSSVVVTSCQVCQADDLQSVLFAGYLPPVNQMRPIGERPREQPAYPAELLYCQNCHLAQLGLVVDKEVLFPPEYPYTSGTTRILCENFAELYTDCQTVLELLPEHLVVDVGSNDGTLLSNFAGNHKVHGIEPSDVGKLAQERGISTTIAFFSKEIAEQTRSEHGAARVVTATNVFAHIEDVHSIVDAILALLDDEGVFISESHYLMSLIETLQYDTVYHEHLRYYSLHSIQFLLERHGLEVIHAKRIPTHGGSIRVYAARKGAHPVRESVAAILAEEQTTGLGMETLRAFRDRVVASKLKLYSLLASIKAEGARIFAIGAPSRGTTLIHYVGLDRGIVDKVLEIKGSLKVGKYMPGTLIPVVEESPLFEEQPEYALFLSWHIADELIPKLRAKGYTGKFIVPLPEPRVVS
jgi:hypothetical protein